MQPTDSHAYSSVFYDYTDIGARRSAERVAALLVPVLGVNSIADFGCGRGTWLKEWSAAGVEDVIGVDGDYVVRSELNIPEDRFRAHDITRPLNLGLRFDLVQSLEVAEHLPAEASANFIDTLTAHGDRVLFSAAVPGQGGEFHINEQPLEYWRALFAERGYAPFDYLRPKLARDAQVQPWYRFNSILYVNEAGMAGLADEVMASRVADGTPFADHSDLSWKVRRALVGRLSPSVVNRISQIRTGMIARQARRRAGG